MVWLIFGGHSPVHRPHLSLLILVSLVESGARLLHVTQDHCGVRFFRYGLWLLVSLLHGRSVYCSLAQDMHRLFAATLRLDFPSGEAHLLTLGALLLPGVNFIPISAQGP